MWVLGAGGQSRFYGQIRWWTVKDLFEFIHSIQQRDPAKPGFWHVVLAYPGAHAVFWHRIGHALWGWGLHLPGMLVSQMSRFLTGIEIHPAAKIGKRLFIDHGMGVVIGATTAIGDDVTIFHGATFGSRDSEGGQEEKRHPTIGDRALVGANATILGPVTVGNDTRIGANAVVLQDVPDGATAVGIPAEIILPRKSRKKVRVV